MGLQLPGDLLPGAVGVVETQAVTEQIGEGNSTSTVTVTLDGDFDAASSMTTIVQGRLEATSGGSSTTAVNDVSIDEGTVDSDGFDVTITLDSAPGAGETSDVVLSIVVAEGGD